MANVGQPSGSQITASGDDVTLPISGLHFSSVKFVHVGGPGCSFNATFEISVDNGVNWVPAPYGKKIDAPALAS